MMLVVEPSHNPLWAWMLIVSKDVPAVHPVLIGPKSN